MDYVNWHLLHFGLNNYHKVIQSLASKQYKTLGVLASENQLKRSLTSCYFGNQPADHKRIKPVADVPWMGTICWVLSVHRHWRLGKKG